MSRRLTGAGLTALMLIPLMLVAEPIRTDLDERATARLLVSRIRVRSTNRAQPFECRGLGLDDLTVTIKGKKVVDPGKLDLDWKWRPTIHALVIDTSASMVGDIAYARHAAKEYVKQLDPQLERALVATFDESVALRQGVTADKERLLGAIDSVQLGGRTSMHDAMYYVMRELAAHRDRPVMVLLSDGADTASFFDMDDVVHQALMREDLTIFAIGVGLQDQGDKPTRQLLTRLAEGTHGAFFDVAAGSSLRKVFSSVRELLENEALLAVEAPSAEAREDQVSVDSTKKACKVKVFKRAARVVAAEAEHARISPPFPEPPQAYSAPVSFGHRKLFRRASSRQIDDACSAGGFFRQVIGEAVDPKWLFHAGQGGVTGCGLDVTMEPGYLYDEAREGWVVDNDRIHIRARPYEIPLPPFAELPISPVGAMDTLADFALTVADVEPDSLLWRQPAAQHSRPYNDHPYLTHGMTFLEMRPMIARAAFLYPEYREWALEKLSRSTQRELDLLADSYRRRAPGNSDEAVRVAARQSEDGRRILTRVESPAPIDLQPYLAAWLGDVTAYDLFRSWEAQMLNRHLARPQSVVDTQRFFDRWWELRRVFFVPSYARTLAVLIPVRDAGCDCIGFYRAVLPRPSWLWPRAVDTNDGDSPERVPLDLIPDVPAGFWLLEQLFERDAELLGYLNRHGFRVTELTYDLLGDRTARGTRDAFREARVVLALETGGSGSEAASRRADLRAGFVLDTTLPGRAEGGVPRNLPRPQLVSLEVDAPADAYLRDLARRVGGDPSLKPDTGSEGGS
ncbi:MAG: VWA domain-containing protein [bacterium]|nr:VWA domain-containing protein [bacterium]